MQALTPVLGVLGGVQVTPAGFGFPGLSGFGGLGALSVLQMAGTGLRIFGDLSSSRAQAEGLRMQDLNVRAAASRAEFERQSMGSAQDFQIRVDALRQSAGLRTEAVQADVAARQEEVAAERERIRGTQEANEIRKNVLRLVARNTAATAASGIDVSSGTAIAGITDAASEGRLQREVVVADARARVGERQAIRGVRLLQAGALRRSAAGVESSAEAARKSIAAGLAVPAFIPAPSAAPAFARSSGLLRASTSLFDLVSSQFLRG